MNWFCKKYSVCEKCEVHFEPATQSRHAELCPEHRLPVMELEDRILRVTDWAKKHWEKLELQMLKEEEEMASLYTKNMQNHFNMMAAQQSLMAAQDQAAV